MSAPICTAKYAGTTPGADATERIIFSTVGLTDAGSGITFDDLGRHWLSRGGVHRIELVLDMDNTEVQTFKAYYTETGLNTSWVQFDEATLTKTAPDDIIYDLLVEGKRDIKISLTNDGGAKTIFVARLVFLPVRDPAA